MEVNLVNHVKSLLQLGTRLVKANPRLTKATGLINTTGEESIAMDVLLEKKFIEYIRINKISARVFSEEMGMINIAQKPDYLITIDPLDGTNNYKVGKGLLPFGTLVAVYQGTKPLIRDVIVAGAIEYSTSQAWIYAEGKTKDLKGNPIKLKTDWQIDISTPLYLDLYHDEGYETYVSLSKKVFIKNTGSTIGNLSYLLSNVASGLGLLKMGAEEVGAVYALIKGAGGAVTDYRGKSLGENPLSPQRKYQFLAGSQPIVDFVVSELS